VTALPQREQKLFCHGFSRIIADNAGLSGVDSMVMHTSLVGLIDSTRKKIRENPCESVARVLA